LKQTTKDSEDKQKIDSTIESEQYVEYHVQNFNFLNEQEDIDEAYNSDNSEIRFFTAVDSVNDNDDEALKENYCKMKNIYNYIIMHISLDFKLTH